MKTSAPKTALPI